MATQPAKSSVVNQRSTLLVVTWIGTLLATFLPDIIWREFVSGDASSVLGARIGILLALLALSFLWRTIRPLRRYFVILLVLHVIDGAVRPLIGESEVWLRWFGTDRTSWFWSNLGVHLLRLLVALAVWGVLVVMGLKRRDYFLVMGQLNAPVEPVRWLGMKAPEPWTSFGRGLAVIISAVTLVFLVLGGRPSLNDLGRVVPLFPAVLLFAAMNAFNEEFPYRAGLLSQLLPVVGKQHALLLTSVLFGLGHFYGVPYGVIGVLMAGFLAWLLGKSMVETQGFFWAWFIHFLQDILIFTFLAMGAVTVGGDGS